MLRPARDLVLIAALSLAACSGSSQPDSGTVDSGEQDVVPDSGTTGGDCASEGQACAPVSNPCCTSLCSDGMTPYVSQVCDPGSNTCLPLVELDGGNPDSVCPGSADAGTTGGFGGGPLPNCAIWQVQTTLAAVASLNGVALPSPSIALAAGSGAGQGQLLGPIDGGAAPALPIDGGTLDAPDGGVCPPYDAGLAATWLPLSGVPDAGALNGVWADTAGDVFVVGQSVGGGGLFLAGNLDGGLQALSLVGQGSILSLTSVIGLGPSEALAGGFTTADRAIILHLLPDGGIFGELPLDAGMAQIQRLTGNGIGSVYALGIDPLGNSQILQRTANGWLELPAPTLDSINSPPLNNLTVGPFDDLWVVGSDGIGDGLAFYYADGGFNEIDLYDIFGTVPPATAIHETAAGELFLSVVPQGTNINSQVPQMLHNRGGSWSNGLWDAGVWDYETLPAEIVSLNAIADDGAGDLYAVGGQEGVTLDQNPDAGGVATVPLVLHRLIP